MNDILHKFIDRGIIKKESILTLVHMKKNMDSVSYVPVEDDFIVEKIEDGKITAMSIVDRFLINVDITSVNYIDGMSIERLCKAYDIG